MKHAPQVEPESFYVGRWHSPEGARTVVARRGRTLVHLCFQDFPVAVASLPIETERHVTPIAYPLARAAKKMLQFGKSGNSTKAAQQLLRAALAWQAPPP